MLSVAVESMERAARMIKEMRCEGEEWRELQDASRRAIRDVLNEHMRQSLATRLEEIRRLGIDDRRNGSFSRHLLTALGDIEVSVPRTRTFSALSVVRAYARRHRDVDRVILKCFLLGLSTRKVGEALLSFLGERVSPSTVSRVARTLDAAVRDFHRRPIADRYEVLLLDGVAISRKTGAGSVRRPVLVAMGITKDGKKEILDFRLATSESQAAWETFLTDLCRRGLRGEHLEMIVVDGGSGLLAALDTVFPKIPIQRCWAHKTRNILDKVREADRDRVKRDLNRIWNAEHIIAARRAARRFADRWEDVYPKAVACLRNDLDELLACFRFDDPDWRRATRTTNAIERRFVEVRRRTRPMGVLSNRTSVERILFAVFSYENIKEGASTPFLLTQNS